MMSRSSADLAVAATDPSVSRPAIKIAAKHRNVDGLTVGQNSLLAKAVDATNVTYRSASLSLTNYPIAGPILSGPHEEPFYCDRPGIH
jgi:hypothetical protein